MKRLIFLALVAACSAPPLLEPTAAESAALGQPCNAFVEFCPQGGCPFIPSCPGRDQCSLTSTDPRIAFTCQFPVEGGE